MSTVSHGDEMLCDREGDKTGREIEREMRRKIAMRELEINKRALYTEQYAAV
jgi:hypothetical protein